LRGLPDPTGLALPFLAIDILIRVTSDCMEPSLLPAFSGEADIILVRQGYNSIILSFDTFIGLTVFNNF
jgi:hypothetical protein